MNLSTNGNGTIKTLLVYLSIITVAVSLGAFLQSVRTYMATPPNEATRPVTMGDLKQAEADIASALTTISIAQQTTLDNQTSIIRHEEELAKSQERLAATFDTWMRLGVSQNTDGNTHRH